MSTKITWHGHANFQITTADCSILIDPFFTGNATAKVSWEEIAPPDLVLVTHLHGDHAGDAVSICKKFNARLGTVVGIAEVFKQRGLPQEQIVNGIGFNIGGTVREKGVAVTMTEATHTTEAGTPTGFILTLENGKVIYHAGDTGIFSTMELWGQLYPIDLALLPAGGVFTMDARQAAMAARLLRAKAAAPMHWGTFPVLEQTSETFRKELEKTAPDCKFIKAEPGQTFEI